MTHSTRYRMYVDESGDDVMDPSKWSSPEARYLGLTGVVIASENYRTQTHQEFEALKQAFFPHDPDEPLVLVRQKIVQKRDDFTGLGDPELATRWETAIYQFLDAHVIQVICVVLDKQAFSGSANTQDPYGYCISVLAKCYGEWLNRVVGTGDVMAEARGGREDRKLRSDFNSLMIGNVGQEGDEDWRHRISSNQIKVNLKSRNIAGLQLADLLAYPSRRGVLIENERVSADSPLNATDRFYELIRSKSYQTRLFLH